MTPRASLTLDIAIGGEVLSLKGYRTMDPEKVEVKRSLRSSATGAQVKRADIDAETGALLSSQDIHKVITVNEISYNCSDDDLAALRLDKSRVLGLVNMDSNDFRVKGSRFTLAPAEKSDHDLYWDIASIMLDRGMLVEFTYRNRQQLGLITTDRFGVMVMSEVAYRDEWVASPEWLLEANAGFGSEEDWNRRAKAFEALPLVENTPKSSFMAKVAKKFDSNAVTPIVPETV